MRVLNISGLSKRYGKITAVDNLSLEVGQGMSFGILGPNGSGKTTTLGIILGIIHQNSGSFTWFGGRYGKWHRHHIGALLETPNFYPYLNAVDNLRLIDVRGCFMVSDYGLENLAGLSNLRALKIRSPQVSDTGLESVRMETPLVEIGSDPFTGLPDTITYRYQLQIDNLHNGWQYAFAVSAFDSGDVKLNLPSLESSRLQNVILVSPGTPPRQPGSNLQVGVYPNPYRTGAIWDGGFERERKLHFYNLPRNCEVRIYTIAGDLVDSFEHRGDFYRGEDILWYQNFSEGNTVFPGGEHAWDLVTDSDQAIATGLYLFTVKDNDTGEVHKGKFVIIK